ncbi:MAG TPA: hypothetical protein VJK72_01035 [Candidatus Nanoarchaeia archaeon]|nr:hypothetical protein [Candidatus Nanoarchaeia archaeon]
MTETPESKERAALCERWLEGYKPNRTETIQLIEQFRTREVHGRAVFAPVIDDILRRLDSEYTDFRYCPKEEGYAESDGDNSIFLGEIFLGEIRTEAAVKKAVKTWGHERIAEAFRIPFPKRPTVSDAATLEAAVLQKAHDGPYVLDFLFNPYNGVGIKFLELLEIYSKGKFKPVMGILEYRFERRNQQDEKSPKK